MIFLNGEAYANLYASLTKGAQQVVNCLHDRQDILAVLPNTNMHPLCFALAANAVNGAALVLSPAERTDSLCGNCGDAVLAFNLDRLAFAEAPENIFDYCLFFLSDNMTENPKIVQFLQIFLPSVLIFSNAASFAPASTHFRAHAIHCVSALKKRWPQVPVAAFCGAETLATQKEIGAALHLQLARRICESCDRPQMFYEVQKPKQKQEALDAALNKERESRAVVRCSSAHVAEEVYAKLCQQGFHALLLHDAQPADTQHRMKSAFLAGMRSILVVGGAVFDFACPEVSLVVHYNMPPDLERYYEETACANGENAHSLLLYGSRDMAIAQYSITAAKAEKAAAEAARRRLKAIIYYCHTNDCLRGQLLRYFGEEAAPDCDRCANCLQNYEQLDITDAARIVLTCIFRLGQPYGYRMISTVLRGETDVQVLALGLDRLPTFGLMREMSDGRIRGILRFLVQEKYLIESRDQFPTLTLSPHAGDLLRADTAIVMRAEREKPFDAAVKKEERIQNTVLLQALTQWRRKTAAASRVPAYVIFTDATLHAMAQRPPVTRAALRAMRGVGENKTTLYGNEVLAVIAEYLKGVKEK